MPTYCTCKTLTGTPGPLDANSTISSSSCCSPVLPSPTGRRRLRRVLYPASQSRRPPLREAPDQAYRWLLLLSALVFLQIYTEEVHPCTEFQSQNPDVTVSTQLQEGEGSLCTSQRCTEEHSCRVKIVAGNCVVSWWQPALTSNDTVVIPLA